MSEVDKKQLIAFLCEIQIAQQRELMLLALKKKKEEEKIIVENELKNCKRESLPVDTSQTSIVILLLKWTCSLYFPVMGVLFVLYVLDSWGIPLVKIIEWFFLLFEPVFGGENANFLIELIGFFFVNALLSFLIAIVPAMKEQYDGMVEHERYLIESPRKREEHRTKLAQLDARLTELNASFLKISKALGKTQNLLETYYTRGIVVEKYARSAYAVFQMIELLKDGICDQLTGPFGAYSKVQELGRLDAINISINNLRGELNVISKQIASLTWKTGEMNKGVIECLKKQNEANDELLSKGDELIDTLEDIQKKQDKRKDDY